MKKFILRHQITRFILIPGLLILLLLESKAADDSSPNARIEDQIHQLLQSIDFGLLPPHGVKTVTLLIAIDRYGRIHAPINAADGNAISTMLLRHLNKKVLCATTQYRGRKFKLTITIKRRD